MLALCVYAAATKPTFLTWQNLVINLLTKASCLGIIACGMTFVMIAGGFDLSVGSTTAACSVVTVLMLQPLAPHGAWVAIPLAILATLLVGILLGSANGALISYVGVNPFVVTLSTMFVFRGLAMIITSGGLSIQVPVALKEGAFRKIYWGQVNLFGSPTHQATIPILVFLAVFLVSVYLLRFTRFGHYVYAVGGNENAAWLAGINTSLVKAATYAICGLTCAISAIIFSSITGTTQAASHEGLELIVIASVIVGGTPLGGGSGSLFLTLNGLLLLSVIENLMGQFRVDEKYRKIVQGFIILVVVAVDGFVRRTRARQRR
jgi:ribose/xylose/arabinose/galactoside ABC-type transport system permease subunit